MVKSRQECSDPPQGEWAAFLFSHSLHPPPIFSRHPACWTSTHQPPSSSLGPSDKVAAGSWVREGAFHHLPFWWYSRPVELHAGTAPFLGPELPGGVPEPGLAQSPSHFQELPGPWGRASSESHKQGSWMEEPLRMRCLTAHMVLPPAPSDGVFFIAPAVGEKHVVLTPRNTELCQQ